LQSQ